MIAKICVTAMATCIAGVILVLVTMIVLGSIVREEQKSMFKANGCIQQYALSAFKETAKTGDILLVSCKAPAWSITDALYRVADGFEETAMVHAAAVYVDEQTSGQAHNNVKIYEFTSSTHRLRSIDDFFKSNSQNIVVARRTNNTHVTSTDLIHYLEEVGAFSEEQDESLSGQVNYLQSTVKRFVMNEERTLCIKNSCNCIDSVIMFLIKAGLCKLEDDAEQIPLIRPVELLYEKIPQIPSLGKPELICV